MVLKCYKLLLTKKEKKTELKKKKFKKSWIKKLLAKFELVSLDTFSFFFF